MLYDRRAELLMILSDEVQIDAFVILRDRRARKRDICDLLARLAFLCCFVVRSEFPVPSREESCETRAGRGCVNRERAREWQVSHTAWQLTGKSDAVRDVPSRV